jgi:hypothetical protein
MIGHRIRRSTTAVGYKATCACGWRVTRRSRQQRDQASDGAVARLYSPAREN